MEFEPIPLPTFTETLSHSDRLSSHYEEGGQYIDPTGYQPFVDWYRYPVTAVFTCRGCIYHCKTCGGSLQTFQSMANREDGYRVLKLLAQDIFNISDHLSGAGDGHRRYLPAG